MDHIAELRCRLASHFNANLASFFSTVVRFAKCNTGTARFQRIDADFPALAVESPEN
ncbi:MAG TPA: hypothetical protein VKN63_01610 [Afifellaceae bacterium]|nr:hypothetical protein [Afifellaceae bacterium]